MADAGKVNVKSTCGGETGRADEEQKRRTTDVDSGQTPCTRGEPGTTVSRSNGSFDRADREAKSSRVAERKFVRAESFGRHAWQTDFRLASTANGPKHERSV
ncbi:hypothetical protein R1flu_004538 [Riccia fluitans]|uniref:Uncharacterized protein n=1 Tax=Riccia fluitans TaxID=41844 RepID=A0ABD1YRK9_9MARC